MAANWQVNGPAIIYVGVGDANAPVRLGYCDENGVRARKFRWVIPLKADVGGPEMPMEFQEAGEALLLTTKLMVWDPDVMDLIRKRGDKADVGKINSIGALIGQNEYSFPIWCLGTNGRPHHGHQCLLYEGEQYNLGTKAMSDETQFYIWPLVDPEADTALDTPLFDYDASAIS